MLITDRNKKHENGIGCWLTLSCPTAITVRRSIADARQICPNVRVYDVREQTQSNAHTDTNTHNVPPNDIVHIGIIQIEPEIDKRI